MLWREVLKSSTRSFRFDVNARMLSLRFATSAVKKSRCTLPFGTSADVIFRRRSRTGKTLMLCAIFSCGLPAHTSAHERVDVDPVSSPTPQLSPITVSAPAQDDRLSPSENAARIRMSRWPGNVSVIGESTWVHGASGLDDVLRGEPGVFAVSAAGQQSGKLSVRGSGLASPLGVRGLALLRDGLPLNQSDGVIDPAYLDPFNARYIEIFRGSNALEYGSATLGGAINIVSPTGRSHPGLQTRLQVGSNGSFRTQARAGQLVGDTLDTFLSLSDFRSDGSAAHSRQRAQRLYGNLGFLAGDRSEGRFHLDIAKLDQDVTSPLTRDQLLGKASLTRPAPRWPNQEVRTRPHVRLGYQHTVGYGVDDTITFGASYIDTRFDLLGTVVPIDFHSRDVILSIRGENRRDLAGHDNRLAWGANLAQGRTRSRTYGPFMLPGGRILDPSTAQYEAISTRAQTATVFLENSYCVTSTMAIITAVQAVSAHRSRDITALRNPRGLPTYFKNVDHDRRYNGINPKLGVLWQADATTQWFANISRSYEPPTAIEFYNSEGTTSAQKATTVELGTRGSTPHVHWQAAVFHSQVSNELLIVPTRNAAGEITGSQGGNIPRTVHAGLELQLGGRLTHAGMTGFLDWDLSYTFSRFRHDNDSTFGSNRLPVIPRHFGQASVFYRHPGGIYLGPDLVFSSSAFVDQANTLRAPGYGVTNFTIGYADPAGRYRVFLNAKNLGDKRYAASTQFMALAGANEAAFNPGLRRALYAGAEIIW